MNQNIAKNFLFNRQKLQYIERHVGRKEIVEAFKSNPAASKKIPLILNSYRSYDIAPEDKRKAFVAVKKEDTETQLFAELYELAKPSRSEKYYNNRLLKKNHQLQEAINKGKVGYPSLKVIGDAQWGFDHDIQHHTSSQDFTAWLNLMFGNVIPTPIQQKIHSGEGPIHNNRTIIFDVTGKQHLITVVHYAEDEEFAPFPLVIAKGSTEVWQALNQILHPLKHYDDVLQVPQH